MVSLWSVIYYASNNITYSAIQPLNVANLTAWHFFHLLFFFHGEYLLVKPL